MPEHIMEFRLLISMLGPIGANHLIAVFDYGINSCMRDIILHRFAGGLDKVFARNVVSSAFFNLTFILER